MISIFVAQAKNRVIGKKGELPWRLSTDMKRFRTITTGHPIIMGRQTYESIPEKFRPLPDRTNIVLTTNPAYEAPDCEVAHSLEEALRTAQQKPGADEVFIIGGGQVYAQAIPYADRIYLTDVDADLGGDTFFPGLDRNQWVVIDDGGFTQDDKNQFSGKFYIYDRKS